MVRESAAYVGIISRRYGQIPECTHRNPDRRSITEIEFNEAMRLGRPILLFIMGINHFITEADVDFDLEKRAKLYAFRERAKRMRDGSTVLRIYEEFESLEQFSSAAAIAIGRLAGLLNRTTENVTHPHGLIADVGTLTWFMEPTVPRHFRGRRDEIRRVSEFPARTMVRACRDWRLRKNYDRRPDREGPQRM